MMMMPSPITYLQHHLSTKLTTLPAAAVMVIKYLLVNRVIDPMLSNLPSSFNVYIQDVEINQIKVRIYKYWSNLTDETTKQRLCHGNIRGPTFVFRPRIIQSAKDESRLFRHWGTVGLVSY